LERVIARFTADFFLHYAALGSEWEVPIFIVGMPRSGTTLVEQILSSHPEVAAGGELAFWAEHAPGFRVNARGDIDPAWVNEVVNDCRTLFTSISSTARRITDKRPNNFHFIGLIHSVFPRARIIHCQRHPIDTSVDLLPEFCQKDRFCLRPQRPSLRLSSVSQADGSLAEGAANGPFPRNPIRGAGR